MAAPRAGTPVSLGAWPSITTLVAGSWTVVNKAISELKPAFAFVFGALGALLITALSDPLEDRYTGWRRAVIYGGLFALNAIILAGAMLGTEEAVDQGLDDAADDPDAPKNDQQPG